MTLKLSDALPRYFSNCARIRGPKTCFALSPKCCNAKSSMLAHNPGQQDTTPELHGARAPCKGVTDGSPSCVAWTRRCSLLASVRVRLRACGAPRGTGQANMSVAAAGAGGDGANEADQILILALRQAGWCAATLPRARRPALMPLSHAFVACMQRDPARRAEPKAVHERAGRGVRSAVAGSHHPRRSKLPHHPARQRCAAPPHMPAAGQ